MKNYWKCYCVTGENQTNLRSKQATLFFYIWYFEQRLMRINQSTTVHVLRWRKRQIIILCFIVNSCGLQFNLLKGKGTVFSPQGCGLLIHYFIHRKHKLSSKCKNMSSRKFLLFDSLIQLKKAIRY